MLLLKKEPGPRYCVCSLRRMANTPNQERSRKYGGSSSFVDAGQPSRAPRQDEQGDESVGSPKPGPGQADGSSAQQGISNRPANEEHAFAGSGDSDAQAGDEGIDDEGTQQGGNRGRV